MFPPHAVAGRSRLGPDVRSDPAAGAVDRFPAGARAAHQDICLVINHLDVLYFNNEELDWIADDSSQDIESIFHKHTVIHISERRLDYI